MLKVLLKKNFFELFRSYFYDAKKNRMRSKGAIIFWIAFFVVMVVGVLGVSFTFMAFGLLAGIQGTGMDWFYFLVMGGVGIMLGTFGSVFSTYSALYLAKDNDLLLSLPIPVRTIIVSRLASVYLMGVIYAGAAVVPALIVYWVMTGVTFAKGVGGILFFLIVTVIVLLLSVLLGWVVAKISVKLKNRSIITVLIALLFLGAYYFFYFKAREVIQSIIENAAIYGEKIKGSAYPLYLFGKVGEGDWLAAAIYTAAAAILFTLVWIIISRTFIKIATATGGVVKKRYVEKTMARKSAFRAFLGKEFKRFTSSPNYMLNCGLGIVLIPAAGVALLIFGKVVVEAIDSTFAMIPGTSAVLFAAGLCMMATMIDTAAPAVSLEGKSIWIPLSLPVDPKVPLRAKTAVQFLLSGVPLLFASVCAAVVVNEAWWVRILIVLAALSYALFNATFCNLLNLRMPLLNWTTELVPIKQSGAVTVALFANWGIVAVFGALYLLAGRFTGPGLYLGIFTVLFLGFALLIGRWIDRKGAEIFKAL